MSDVREKIKEEREKFINDTIRETWKSKFKPSENYVSKVIDALDELRAYDSEFDMIKGDSPDNEIITESGWVDESYKITEEGRTKLKVWEKVNPHRKHFVKTDAYDSNLSFINQE